MRRPFFMLFLAVLAWSGCGQAPAVQPAAPVAPAPAVQAVETGPVLPPAQKGDFEFQVAFKITKEGILTEGDTVYFAVRSGALATVAIAFSTDGTTWETIRDNVSLEKSKNQTAESYICRPVVWRIPALGVRDVLIRARAVTSDKRTAEDFTRLDRMIDAVTPKSRITYDPFTLE